MWGWNFCIYCFVYTKNLSFFGLIKEEVIPKCWLRLAKLEGIKFCDCKTLNLMSRWLDVNFLFPWLKLECR